MSQLQLNSIRRRLLVFMGMVGTALAIASSGCDQSPESNSDSGDSQSAQMPKMKFHRPDDFKSAVARLSDIAQKIHSDDPLPEPLRFKVLEVIHGTGVSAHSHYYLADSHDDDDGHEEHGHDDHDEHGHDEHDHDEHGHDDHDHDGHGHDDHDHHGEDMESSEKLHEIEVDVFTELTDIVRWLPEIAGDSDMDKWTWDEVNSIASAFTEHLDRIGKDKTTDAERRSAYQSEQKATNDFITQLKNLDTPEQTR